MRNLKKVLSLVLALVMTLSLANVAFAATDVTTTETTTAFTDAGTIENADAVNLLNSLSVLVGYEDGSYGPTKTVTRAEAAAIICRILLGSDVAETLADATAETGFTDMAGAEWASGYIQYCSTIGVINGYGDGTFGPSNPVTTYQLAKMLLCALGYGQNGEYVGSSWATNVAVQSMKLGILAKGTVNKDCTRDMTALYTYNTLFVDQVTYNSTKGTYDKQDGDSVALGKIIEAVFSMKEISGVVTFVAADADAETDAAFIVDDGTDTVAIPASLSDIGRTVSVWAQADSEGDYTAITAFEYDDTITNTITDGAMDVADTTSDDYVNVSDVTLVVVNGDAATYDKDDIATFIKAGVEIVLINNDTDSKVDTVLITEKTVGTVGTDGVTVTTSGSDTTVSVDDIADYDLAEVAGYETLTAGDVVLYATFIDGVTYFETAQTVQGIMTFKNTASSEVTIGGTTYELSGLANSIANYNAMTSFEDPYTLYLDNNGTVVAVVAADTTVDTTATDTYLVTAVVVKNELNTSNTLKTNTYVRTVNTSGVLSDLLVASVAYTTAPAAYLDENGDAVVAGLYEIVYNTTDKVYDVTPVAATLAAVGDVAGSTAGATDLSKAVSITDGTTKAYVNSATNYIFVTYTFVDETVAGTADDTTVTNATTGSTAYNTSATPLYVATKTANGNIANAVFVSADYSVTSSDVVYVNSGARVGQTADGYQYTLYVNGVKTTAIVASVDGVDVTAATVLATTDFYDYSVNSDGAYVLTTGAAVDAAALTYGYGDLFDIDGTADYADVDFGDALIVDLASTNGTANNTLAELKANAADLTVVVVYTDSTESAAAVVYVTAD